MTTRWRRRQICVLVADPPQPAAIRSVSGLGAFLETNARPVLGARITLRHPDAGPIAAVVAGHYIDGVALGFDGGEAAVAFAMSAIAADMSRPG